VNPGPNIIFGRAKGMKSHLIRFAIPAIVLISFGCSGCHPEYRTFTLEGDFIDQFSLQYPSSYEMTSLNADPYTDSVTTVCFARTKLDREISFQVSIGVPAVFASGNVTDRALHSSPPSVIRTLIERGPVTIDGITGEMIIYSEAVEGGPKGVCAEKIISEYGIQWESSFSIIRKVIIGHNERCCILDMASDPAYSEQAESDFDFIIGSFTFLN